MIEEDLLLLRQVTALARLLRIPPGDLLVAGCPQTRAAATHRLADWIGPAGDASAAPAAPATAATVALPSPEELAAMIRAALRQELAARKVRREEERVAPHVEDDAVGR